MESVITLLIEESRDLETLRAHARKIAGDVNITSKSPSGAMRGGFLSPPRSEPNLVRSIKFLKKELLHAHVGGQTVHFRSDQQEILRGRPGTAFQFSSSVPAVQDRIGEAVSR